jgi:hypothetical protein
LIKGTPLKLFDDEIVHAAKRRQITEWPDSKRFPLNFDSMRVEEIVREDLKASFSPLIVTGFTSLDYLIDFVADLPIDQPEKICILLGSEPSPARRQDYSLGSSNFPQEVTDYWLEVGISLRLCHKIVLL